MDYKKYAERIVKEHYDSGFDFYKSEGMKKYFQKKREKHKYFCIFGGGVLGTTLCNWLKKCGIKVDFFCDNDRRKKGVMISGVPLIDFFELYSIKDETFVMVSATNKGKGHRHNDDINWQLREFPYKMPTILKFIAFYTNDYYLPYKECLDGAGRIANSLGDEQSKALFLELLKLRFIDNPNPICAHTLERFYNPVQYFHSNYYQHTDDAVIVDCGAYNGDSLREFIGLFQNRFKRYFCFEMDREAYLSLEQYKMQMSPKIRDKVVLYPYGVFSESGIFHYNALTDTLGSFINEKGKQETQLVMLDEILENEKVTMIKMDIENSELSALMGAKKLVERCHPILAVSIYHSTEQFFKVPLYLLNQFPFYKLYLGLHTTVTDDTVVYAVPDEKRL